MMNREEQVARIERMQEETRKFVAETRDNGPSGGALVIIGMIAGATLVGATAAFMKWVT
ncbi:hypothetical protein ONR75_10425 [Rhodopseudomonas sp. P2A-2r]|uniref:hypothetical protein n=1 Tax=Rhodopseudomonas sp. P2A-2r TaxID=2991972 RepID=UPI0022343E87|nr:hypothetical protein [Rhodopseudomonas sp. P2A-2r]UZE50991.1 hypothetical protein ONR75_10425 [Rhodopseudomonas sp. P2A-2r]